MDVFGGRRMAFFEWWPRRIGAKKVICNLGPHFGSNIQNGPNMKEMQAGPFQGPLSEKIGSMSLLGLKSWPMYIIFIRASVCEIRDRPMLATYMAFDPVTVTGEISWHQGNKKFQFVRG